MSEIAKIICDKAIEDGCTDNVTLIIIDLHSYYLAHHKTTVIDFEEIDLGMKAITHERSNNKVLPLDL